MAFLEEMTRAILESELCSMACAATEMEDEDDLAVAPLLMKAVRSRRRDLLVDKLGSTEATTPLGSFHDERTPLNAVEVPGDSDHGVPDLAAQMRFRHSLQLGYKDAGDIFGEESLHVAFLNLDLDAASSELLGEVVWH